MGKDDVRDFYELRRGLQALGEFATAALRFLDIHGIGITAKRNVRSTNNGADALRTEVKRQYTKQQPIATPRLTPKAEKLRHRQLSATVLESLDRAEPRQPIPEGRKTIGALVRRGYARKKSDGYVRTAKRFVIDPAGATDEHATLTVDEAARLMNRSNSYVRTLIKTDKLTARQESRARPGNKTAAVILVVDREEIARYHARQAEEESTHP